MRICLLICSSFGLAAWLCFPGLADEKSEAPVAERDESELLARIHRITYEGRRGGEGYFSTDGKRLVFQSERDSDNPFYQIYLMDLTTGDVKRISTGVGKTTCSFINPTAPQIMFASTHHDPISYQYQAEELQRRESGEERRYAWDYDPEFDIHTFNTESGEYTRLTRTRGYDAEGAYSPDGRLIVFTSTRDAYNRELSEAEQARLDSDPSYFAEITIMNADGSDPRRLTHVPGYDGGPFFSPDGQRIVWRRFDEDGVIADVWTMNVDGADARQITDFQSMSWAPYYHPSSEYIFFASNKHGFSNFELFIVDVQGRKEPVRVTTTDGFDGLPVPSPDGRKLAWTSNRHGGKGQIYMADWNHERALELLEVAPPRNPER